MTFFPFTQIPVYPCSGEDMISSSEVHDKGDPVGRPLSANFWSKLYSKSLSLVKNPHNVYILQNQMNGTTALRTSHLTIG